MEGDGVDSLSFRPCRPGTTGFLAANHQRWDGRGDNDGGTLRTGDSGVVSALWRYGDLTGICLEAVRSRNEQTRASGMVGLVRDGPWCYNGKNHATFGMAARFGAGYPYLVEESQEQRQQTYQTKRGMMPNINVGNEHTHPFGHLAYT